jgi:hypothetical protein
LRRRVEDPGTPAKASPARSTWSVRRGENRRSSFRGMGYRRRNGRRLAAEACSRDARCFDSPMEMSIAESEKSGCEMLAETRKFIGRAGRVIWDASRGKYNADKRSQRDYASVALGARQSRLERRTLKRPTLAGVTAYGRPPSRSHHFTRNLAPISLNQRTMAPPPFGTASAYTDSFPAPPPRELTINAETCWNLGAFRGKLADRWRGRLNTRRSDRTELKEEGWGRRGLIHVLRIPPSLIPSPCSPPQLSCPRAHARRHHAPIPQARRPNHHPPQSRIGTVEGSEQARGAEPHARRGGRDVRQDVARDDV